MDVLDVFFFLFSPPASKPLVVVSNSSLLPVCFASDSLWRNRSTGVNCSRGGGQGLQLQKDVASLIFTFTQDMTDFPLISFTAKNKLIHSLTV